MLSEAEAAVAVLVLVVVNGSASSFRTVVAVGGGGAEDAVAATTRDAGRCPATIQHFLCFLPEPQGHLSLGFVFFGGMLIDGSFAFCSLFVES